MQLSDRVRLTHAVTPDGSFVYGTVTRAERNGRCRITWDDHAPGEPRLRVWYTPDQMRGGIERLDGG